MLIGFAIGTVGFGLALLTRDPTTIAICAGFLIINGALVRR
jgi:hypothetical protein